MNRKLIILLVLLFAAAGLFAQEADELDLTAEDLDFVDDYSTPEEILAFEEIDDAPEVVDSLSGDELIAEETDTPTDTSTEEIHISILNNQYYLESVRLNGLAREAFDMGDYDAAADYARQASENARLSDAYVSMCLAEDALARAHSRYSWAGTIDAARRYPREYQTADAALNEAQEARKGEDWEKVADASYRVLNALANITGPGGDKGPGMYHVAVPPIPPQGTTPQGALPAQYTVRPWNVSGDCFSAIAGRSWVYNDPRLWRTLYEANKNKLPNPNNPNLILPGMIMDIPSLKDESRSGMWDPSVKY
ncbi:MAG: LysM peptidoglycan-binding domain-containing protein [Treponema sp.]|jgi:nucleoid-associated protein YgaU|nr:LysM peptidoglycan-binding domain-containing protein [Treponema sp.]